MVKEGKKMKDFEIKTEKGTYIVAELKEPNGIKTYDVVMVFKDGIELTMIDYLYGVSLMTNDEIEKFALAVIKRYEGK